MPMHDWTKVPDGTYHAHHFGWIGTILEMLNDGILPNNRYALAAYPHRMMLASNDVCSPSDEDADFRPVAAVRDAASHRLVAVLKIVSRENKSSARALQAVADRLAGWLIQGVHVLLIDPAAADTGRVHAETRLRLGNAPPTLPDWAMTVVSYHAEREPEAFIDGSEVGELLPDMPLFVGADAYVTVPLERSYQSAFDRMPKPSRAGLESPSHRRRLY